MRLCAAPEIATKDRLFLREVNRLASDLRTSAFGDAGLPNPGKAARILRFVEEGKRVWPEFGEGGVARSRGFEEVDPDCPFWRNGRTNYLRALKGHISAVNTKATAEATRRELLADLGFFLSGDFVTEEEELALVDYWRPNGPAFRQGSNEQHTNRRFFHYGPILPRQAFGTTRSTLGVIPGRLGAMPPPVEEFGLRGRVRSVAESLGDKNLEFDQLYVNYYSAAAKGRIGFHHDHPGTMHGVVAGISLKSDCEFQLLALDVELSGQPTVSVRLPARSLYVMSGISRYHLQHGIVAHSADRLSMTFRSVDMSSAGGTRRQWAREWSALPPAEAAKCHWPLLPPPPADD